MQQANQDNQTKLVCNKRFFAIGYSSQKLYKKCQDKKKLEEKNACLL